MTTYSKSDLATRVLRDLGIADAREDADADDIAWVEETISSVIMQLQTENIFVWDGSDEIVPQEYLVQLSKRIGLDVGPSFGLFSIAQAEVAKKEANNTLRKMNAKPATGSTVDVDYF